MMDLLLQHGCLQYEQRAALKRILIDNNSLHMVCMEMLHFMSMTTRLLDRDPDLLTEEVSDEFNAGYPLMVRSCEKKWFEEAIELAIEDYRMNIVLDNVPAFLRRVTPPSHYTLRPDTFRTLTMYRCYRTLAVLFRTYGGRASCVPALAHMISVPPANMEDIYCHAHQLRGFPVELVTALHTRRVRALITIMARLFPVSETVRDFLAQYFRVLIGDNDVMLSKSLYKLQNRCVSVLKQEVLMGRLTDSYVASRLPIALYNDIYQSGIEYSTLTIYDPTVLF